MTESRPMLGAHMEVSRVKEFTVYLADRPGELAGVLEALAAAGATVTAVSVVEVNGRGLVRLLAEPEETVRRVCESIGETGAGPVAETEVLAVHLGASAGAFREVAVRLADAKVNVKYAYQSPAHNGTAARWILRVEEPERAEAIIREVV